MASAGKVDIVPIVAVAYDRVIGFENRLPWKLPADLRRFKETTMGHPVVMGRKTFESIGRPLPGRTCIVVTRQDGYRAPEGVLLARTPREAFEAAARLDRRVFVIGGAELYASALPHATEVLATLVYHRFRGDAHFPALGPAWHVASREDFEGALAGGEPLPCSFVRLVRAGGADGCALCLVHEGKAVASGSRWDDGLAEVLAALAPS